MITPECAALVDGELRPRRGSARIFTSPIAEAFTRSPPWLPFVWLVPLIASVVEHTGLQVVAVMAGAGGWCLLEYLMHRFFFHLPGSSRVARGVRFLVHEHHHAFPHDRDRLVATPWQFALALAVVAPFAKLSHWPSVLVGTTGAYLIYEAIHYRIHHAQQRGRILEALRAHHLRHHAPGGETYAFGISSPLFDVVFGTRHAR